MGCSQVCSTLGGFDSSICPATGSHRGLYELSRFCCQNAAECCFIVDKPSIFGWGEREENANANFEPLTTINYGVSKKGKDYYYIGLYFGEEQGKS